MATTTTWNTRGWKESKGFVSQDGALLVPMRNVITNKVQGVQTIRWITEQTRYEKKMLFGMQARNAVLRLGPKTAQETFQVKGMQPAFRLRLPPARCV